MSREPADWPSKRVIITAAATGIGLAIAKTFHALGAKVWISDIAADKLEEAKAAMPGCGTMLCDVAKPDQVDAFVEASTKAMGGLDILINNPDVPITTVLAFMALVLPFSLTFTIPWGFLTALLLVFGRMSADNELIALKSNGVSVPRTCVPAFVLAVVLSLICFWINIEVAPKAEQAMTRAVVDIATSNPASLFRADAVVDRFPDRRVYVEKKHGNKLLNIIVFELDDDLMAARAGGTGIAGDKFAKAPGESLGDLRPADVAGGHDLADPVIVVEQLLKLLSGLRDRYPCHSIAPLRAARNCSGVRPERSGWCWPAGRPSAASSGS